MAANAHGAIREFLPGVNVVHLDCLLLLQMPFILTVRKKGKPTERKLTMPAIAKITAKGQTTIPLEIRNALHVAPGDLIEWEISADGTATVRRVQPLDLEYLRALEGTLTEWGTAEDEAAYRDL